MNQKDAVLGWMREHPEGISQRTAVRAFGCYRLASRISELRSEGYAIVSDLKPSDRGGYFAQYRLIEPEPVKAAPADVVPGQTNIWGNDE